MRRVSVAKHINLAPGKLLLQLPQSILAAASPYKEAAALPAACACWSTAHFESKPQNPNHTYAQTSLPGPSHLTVCCNSEKTHAEVQLMLHATACYSLLLVRPASSGYIRLPDSVCGAA